MEKISPNELFYKLFKTSARDPILHGNQTKICGLQVLQKISSENNTKCDLDSNIHLYLLKLCGELRANKIWYDDQYPGYIQKLGSFPFEVICFSGKSLACLYNESLISDCVWLHYDSTGSILQKPKDQPDAQIDIIHSSFKGLEKSAKEGFLSPSLLLIGTVW